MEALVDWRMLRHPNFTGHKLDSQAFESSITSTLKRGRLYLL